VTGSGSERAATLVNAVAILLLLAAVAIVFARLPKIDLGHSPAYERRRVMNWLPLGLTYAFLYMGRYNLKVSKHAFEEIPNPAGEPLMTNADFATIFAWGTAVYGASFLVNGPLTDRFGGKRAILTGAVGAAVANFAMYVCTIAVTSGERPFLAEHFVLIFSLLYAVNMYFQSFGAAAIVKVNAPWFHVRERGTIGALFGILISLGILFAFDGSSAILGPRDPDGGHVGQVARLPWVFLAPAVILLTFAVIDFFVVANSPGDAGFEDFDTGDASSGDDGPQLTAVQVFRKMLTSPVIMTIAFIEFCSGFLRQAIMQWFRTYAKQTDGVLGLRSSYDVGVEAGDVGLVLTGFVYQYWGLLLCVAGILGGTFAGLVSDRVFDSRRGPVAGLLYGVMLVGAILLCFTYTHPAVGYLVVFMSMAVIGVHGMLSGTASMDFGGKKNVGVAVGIIDGFVYAGTAVMSITYGFLLPQEQLGPGQELVGPATDPANWWPWPAAMVPLALLGFVLSLRLWNARPQPKGPATAAPPAEVGAASTAAP
jgi:OPA family glycerol-3-phosphate transporter-like MFS transporter